MLSAALELRKRIRREIERAESPGADSTHLVGGWGKIGNCAQRLICESVRWIAAAEQLEVEDVLRGASAQDRPLDEASFLTLGRIIKSLRKTDAAKDTTVRRIVQDANASRSVLTRIARKRRDKVHEREEDVRPTEDLRDLRDFSRFANDILEDLQPLPQVNRRRASRQ